MNIDLKDGNTDRLYKAILALETEEECRNFFEDLCTVFEIKAMAQRLAVAELLLDKLVYSDIVEKTGASTATISRVNRSLYYGKNGYKCVLERIEEKDSE